MPYAQLPGARVHYRWDGPEGAPVLVLSSSLGTSLEMWAPQVAPLGRHLRLLRYDTRGHGQSDVPDGPCTIEMLGRDVVALLDALGVERASFCGLSMGGMIGMWLGAHAPGRIERLVLCCTSPYIGGAEQWNARIELVRREGMAALVETILGRWFTPRFRDAEPEAVERIRRMLLVAPPAGYAACCAAVREMDLRAALAHIRAPTLVVCGAHDPGTPPAQAKAIAAGIDGTHLVELDASHLANVEAAGAFNDAVLGFLRGAAARGA